MTTEVTYLQTGRLTRYVVAEEMGQGIPERGMRSLLFPLRSRNQ